MEAPDLVKVLIVDDDEDVLESMLLHLESLGHDAVGLQDPDGVLDAAEQERPDVILQDLKMEGLSVAGLVASLRSYPPTADIPLVFFSADPALDRIAKKHDVWGYLPKPFTERQLRELLDRFVAPQKDLARRAAADSAAHREMRDLFHDQWNLLSAFNSYLRVLLESPRIEGPERKAAQGIEDLLLKLEARTERLRASLLAVLETGPEEAPRRPPRPARRDGAAERPEKASRPEEPRH